MRVRAPVPVALVLAALAPLPALAQPADPAPIASARGRDVAWRFLAQGAGAPRPALTLRSFQAAEAYPRDLAFPPHRGPLLELCWPPSEHGRPRLVVGVARSGRVVSYTAFDQGFMVARQAPDGSPRPRGEIEEEIAARTRFQPAELEQRALRFLRHAYRDWDARRFRIYRSEAWSTNPIVHQLAWEEEPGDGVLAVYPNRVLVGLNPETGEVVSYLATDVEDTVRAPPPISGARAEELARAEEPGAPVEERRLLLLLKQGKARAVWLVELGGERPRAVIVDAQSGALLDPEES